jgi:hypothetical protein
MIYLRRGSPQIIAQSTKSRFRRENFSGNERGVSTSTTDSLAVSMQDAVKCR